MPTEREKRYIAMSREARREYVRGLRDKAKLLRKVNSPHSAAVVDRAADEFEEKYPWRKSGGRSVTWPG